MRRKAELFMLLCCFLPGIGLLVLFVFRNFHGKM